MNNFEEYLFGVYSLFTFNRYTTMSRGLEIAYGVAAWYALAVIIYGITKTIA